MQFSNFHTHTRYCDGKNTAEEIVKAAIQKNFAQLGFSGHGYTPFDDSFCMSVEGTERYRQEITALKEKYKGKLSIFLGCEEDISAPVDHNLFDYVISSYHYVCVDGSYVSVDESKELFCKIAKDYFGGDFYAFAKTYYRQLAEGLSKGHGVIIGHLDLFTKYNEGQCLFSEEDRRYRHGALEVLEAARDSFLEVNTGAMARGYRKSPYPAKFLLAELASKKKTVVLTSDCHQKENLDFAFPETVMLLKSLGFSEGQILFSPF